MPQKDGVFMISVILMFFIGSARGETLHYSYDAMGRVLRSTSGSGATRSFVYDRVGNRVLAAAAGAEVTQNQPPNAPSDPSIDDGATEVSALPTLTWVGSDPDGDPLAYALSLGGSEEDLTYQTIVTTAEYRPDALSSGQRYCWQVIATDVYQASTTGPLWCFTTGVALCPPRRPAARQASCPNPARYCCWLAVWSASARCCMCAVNLGRVVRALG